MRRAAVRFLVISSLILPVGCDDGPVDPPTPDAGPLIDRCLGSSDMDIILASRVDGGPVAAGMDDPRVAIGYCTTSPACYPLVLVDDPDAVYCIQDCLQTTPAGGLTMDCLVCYYFWLDCAGNHCLVECLGAGTDGGSPELCYSCAETYCGADLTTCVGY